MFGGFLPSSDLYGKVPYSVSQVNIVAVFSVYLPCTAVKMIYISCKEPYQLTELFVCQGGNRADSTAAIPDSACR